MLNLSLLAHIEFSNVINTNKEQCLCTTTANTGTRSVHGRVFNTKLRNLGVHPDFHFIAENVLVRSLLLFLKGLRHKNWKVLF